MNLYEITQYLDDLLKIKDIEDKSLNGLLVENGGDVESLTAGVDISIKLVESSPDNSLILVHHGIFWGKPLPITRNIYKIIHSLITKNCALYVSHLPLDNHEEFGNNYGFYKLAGWDKYKIEKFDLSGIIEFSQERTIEDVLEEVYKVLGKDIILWNFGKKGVKRVLFVSGGAAYQIPEVLSKNVDLYITGETSHNSYWIAKDNNINVVFGGHYNTEKIGVNLLVKHLAEKFVLKYKFIDLPTGF
ncbi:MAG TPA: Nif3-like dinuclear metal center hexameric protein [Candidatus Eremiobacteraeota bacterium]|nr:MAG: putative GTP cyclohydrolase 1 type 2 [bacterium ADurb.Bin363]HPZ10629.1 Nif3-like dinuclear metal center hexameric protein [Candidatus Eremiobacteraeota bacterium]